jgi:hypothetical protein
VSENLRGVYAMSIVWQQGGKLLFVVSRGCGQKTSRQGLHSAWSIHNIEFKFPVKFPHCCRCDSRWRCVTLFKAPPEPHRPAILGDVPPAAGQQYKS